ncbi:MAG TPA: PAS domain-containing protein, partial [Polyangiaceae bacterium]|nr:PAS domain-containing protein [Polyangiaceae bacterium]
MGEIDFQAVVAASGLAVGVLDRQHRYAYANAALEQLWGLSPTALSGSSGEALLSMADVPRWNAALEDVFDTGRAQELEFAVQTASGERRCVASLSRLSEALVRVAWRDITELPARLAVEQQARRDAEATRDRTRRLHQLIEMLSGALAQEAVTRILVDAGRGALDAGAGFAWLLREDGALELAACEHGGSEERLET